MIYPNTNQISALTGRTIKPDYESYIQSEVAALPQYLRLKEERDYNDRMYNLGKRSLAEDVRQGNLNYMLTKEQADAAKKNQLYGNLIAGGGLALNAYQALDESGINLGDTAGRALDYVLPDSTSSLSEFSKPGSEMAYNNYVSTPTSSISQLAQDWVVQPISNAAENVGDFVTETIPNAAKKVGDYASDAWSDVSGWVEGLFS